MSCNVEPVFTRLNAVIERREHPHLAVLEPDKFIGIVDLPRAIKTGKVAAMLPIDGVRFPKGNHIIEKGRFVLVCKGLKVTFHENSYRKVPLLLTTAAHY